MSPIVKLALDVAAFLFLAFVGIKAVTIGMMLIMMIRDGQ